MRQQKPRKRHPARITLIVKGEDGKLIEIEDEPVTDKTRDRLRELIEMIEKKL